MKSTLKVQSIHQTVQPEFHPPLRYNIRLTDDSGLTVHVVHATAAQMLPFARIDEAGNPVQRRDGSIEPGDVLTLLDNDPPAPPAAPDPVPLPPSPPAAPDPVPLPPALPGEPVAFPQPS